MEVVGDSCLRLATLFRRLFRTVMVVFLVCCFACGSALLWGWWQVHWAMSPQTPLPTSAAIVLGASVWPGARPSPTLSSRTLAAVDLYNNSLVSYIATTGGVSGDYPSEGYVAAELAKQHGVPEEHLIKEETSTSTWENLSNVLPLLAEEGITGVTIVSDGFHLARARRMAQDLGFTEVQIWGSPAVVDSKTYLWYEFREVGALLSYTFLGPEGVNRFPWLSWLDSYVSNYSIPNS